MSKYLRLFSPLQIGSRTMKKRIETGPMSIVELDPKGAYTDQCVAFYENLAAGGAAMITLGESIVAGDNGMTHLQQIRFDNPNVPYSLQRIADAVHSHNALISIEISHGGSMAYSVYNNGVQTMGPTGMVDEWGDTIREMTYEDMDRIADAFADAAQIGSIALYSASRMLTVISQNAMYVAIYAIINNWFISTRGRVLGFVTVANALSPLSINILTRIIVATDNFPLVYGVYGVIVIIVGILTFIFAKDKPENCGLYPDGLIRSEEEIAVLTAEPENEWSNKRLLHTKEAWLLMIAVACCQINMGGFMSIFIVRMQELGVGILMAVNFMSAVSIVGIALSVLWGFIDDKIGTPRTATILGCGYLLANVCMLIAGWTNGNMIFILLAVFFAGSMVGGLPNLHPSLYAFVFGRKQFTYVERSLGVVRIAICAPFTLLWNYIYEWTGTYQSVYIICGALALLATICYANVRKTYDPERLALHDVVKYEDKN